MVLHEKLKKHKVYLASQSPRRKMLLEGLDLEFEVFVKPGIDESVPKGLSKYEIPVFLAEHKSNAYQELLRDDTLVITADTIVWHNNRELGKPKDYPQAFEVIKELSGSMHEVITGVCIRSKSQMKKFYSLSEVWFRELLDSEIQFYLEKYTPYDKAGSYGIQEWIGYAAIEKINGSFYNVMGLPVQKLYSELSVFLEKEDRILQP